MRESLRPEKRIGRELRDSYTQQRLQKDYDLAEMITKDSDLLEPMQIVKQELGLLDGRGNSHKTLSFRPDNTQRSSNN